MRVEEDYGRHHLDLRRVWAEESDTERRVLVDELLDRIIVPREQIVERVENGIISHMAPKRSDERVHCAARAGTASRAQCLLPQGVLPSQASLAGAVGVDVHASWVMSFVRCRSARRARSSPTRRARRGGHRDQLSAVVSHGKVIEAGEVLETAIIRAEIDRSWIDLAHHEPGALE